MRGHSKKTADCKPQRGLSPELHNLAPWSQTSQTSELWKINFCCLSHTVYCILLKQPELRHSNYYIGRSSFLSRANINHREVWIWRTANRYRTLRAENITKTNRTSVQEHVAMPKIILGTTNKETYWYVSFFSQDKMVSQVQLINSEK